MRNQTPKIDKRVLMEQSQLINMSYDQISEGYNTTK